VSPFWRCFSWITIKKQGAKKMKVYGMNYSDYWNDSKKKGEYCNYRKTYSRTINKNTVRHYKKYARRIGKIEMMNQIYDY
jgi:hypothetical protein